MRDVIRAKLEQHPELGRRFVATRPRPIAHVTPGPESERFPGSAFCGILTELREEFAAASGKER